MGDNLDWLGSLKDGSIDLCYIDPPFASNRSYQILGPNSENRAFNDSFEGGVSGYIDWMRPRLKLIHKKLAETGSIFLHCDWHASHRLRCLLDEIFGEKNFRNEIVWKRKNGRGETNHKSNKFGTNTDIILFYAKSKSSKFYSIYSNNDPGYQAYVEKFFKHTDEDGRKYQIDNLSSPSPRPNLKYIYKGYQPPKNGWAISKEKMEAWDKEGRLHFPKDKSGRIRRKRYADELKGKPIQGLWDDIEAVSTFSGERVDYPTQKPEALIKRIIECSTEKGDTVLDCFVGAGTTAKVAAEMSRNFIVGDLSPVAVRITADRLNRTCSNVEYEIYNIPKTQKEIKAILPTEFKKLVLSLVGWENLRNSNKMPEYFELNKREIIFISDSMEKISVKQIKEFHKKIASSKLDGIIASWALSAEAKKYLNDVNEKSRVKIKELSLVDIIGPILIPHETRAIQKEIMSSQLENKKNEDKDAA